jgi:hypothetical protein
MQTIKIPTYREIKLNSFRPLCWTAIGQRAVQTYNLPPFIDASCRREPDLENPFPSISALCRQGKFAPHLKPGDIVVYITVSGSYHPHKEKHHRLLAILQVEETYPTHRDGQIGYSKLKTQIPSNCMISGNPPLKFDKTAGNFKTQKQIKQFLKLSQQDQEKIGLKILQQWDDNYLLKSQHWPTFVRTRNIYSNVTDPTPIFRSDFEDIFKRIPNTRQPNKISARQFQQLAKLAGLDILLGQ